MGIRPAAVALDLVPTGAARAKVAAKEGEDAGMLTDERLAEIEALARKATVPTWRQGTVWTACIMVPHHEGLAGPGGERVLLRMNEHFPHEDDCAFIGAMQPETALAMVAELRSLRIIAFAAERVVRLRGWSEVAERTPPVLGEAERELVRLVGEWKR